MNSGKRPLQLDLECRRIDLLYRGSVTGPIAIMALTTAFVYLTWHSKFLKFNLIWYCLANLNALARFLMLRRWMKVRANIQTPMELEKWHRRMVLSTLVSGLSWGALGWVTVKMGTPYEEMLAGLVIFGMTAGAVPTFSQSLKCVSAILFPSVSIWALAMILADDPGHHVTAGLLVMYIVLMYYLGKNLNAYYNSGLELMANLRTSEERLRLARDSSSAMTWEWDVASDCLTCEGSLNLLFGIQANILNGKLADYLKHVHPEDVPKLKALMQEIIANGQSEVDTEHRTIWSDGSVHYIAVKGKISFDENKRPARVIGICWDITGKKNEEKLRHERDVMEAANRAKMVFLANASHEIRTPLAAINGYAESLLDQPLPAEVRDDVSVILRNGKYMVSVVNDLLDLSKSESDRIFISKSVMSPVGEIHDSVLVVKSALARKGLNLVLRYDSLVPETIFNDCTRFRQILTNLLTNAVKFTERGTITVSVGCTRIAPNQGLFKIQIADTGLGISEETRKNLFEPFARGESQEVQRVPGSGLGLALSRSLCRAMGGDVILVETKPGKGSVFEMIVETGPLQGVSWVPGESLQAPDNSEPVESALSNADLRLVGQRILVAEDDPDLRELMERYLSKHGAHVETCDNGAEAVERAMRSPFNVVLMDIKMPLMDGYQATALLRERGYRQSIVALTAHASSDDKQMCYQAGCDSYLSKPVNTRHLIDVLTRLHA